jgi:hypothetical protein
LDIVHFQNLIHSDEYLTEQLLKVTNDFNITEYIFTITRDNATTNNSMLDEFETAIKEQFNAKPNNLQQL